MNLQGKRHTFNTSPVYGKQKTKNKYYIDWLRKFIASGIYASGEFSSVITFQLMNGILIFYQIILHVLSIIRQCYLSTCMHSGGREWRGKLSNDYGVNNVHFPPWETVSEISIFPINLRKNCNYNILIKNGN